MVYISATQAGEVSRLIEVSKRIRVTLAKISAINLELIARGELS
jgi:hypothetical protein